MYIQNKEFEVVDSKGNGVVLLSPLMDVIYSLDEVEAIIWNLFHTPCDVECAYFDSLKQIPEYEIEKIDFLAFVHELIDKSILIEV